jgi:hypothetical protein
MDANIVNSRMPIADSEASDRHRAFAISVALYLIALASMLALVLAANQQQVIAKDEVSTAFVYPSFLELRLQHHILATNFYAYVFFSGVDHLHAGVFASRFAKSAVMALTCPAVFLYLLRRFAFEFSEAAVAAVIVVLLPGVMCLSWVGVEFGMDTPIGFLALWLALFPKPGPMIASCVGAALAAGAYGSGLAFLTIVILQQFPRFYDRKTRSAALIGMICIAAILVFPIVWWTNAQSLFVGGGGHPRLAGATVRLTSLFRELFVLGDSYYFFSGGVPAMGNLWIGILSLTGVVWGIVRYPQKCWPLLGTSAVVVVLYAAAGNVTGVRRAMPLVVCLGIFAAVFLRDMASKVGARRIPAYFAPMLVILAAEAATNNRVRLDLAHARITLPRDFEFQVAPGKSMISTIEALASGARKLPADLAGYEPDRTLAMLYQLTQPHPIISAHELVERCDQHGWSIPSRSRRFSRLVARP